MALARKIANQLDIPFYAIDAKNVFEDTIVDYFINGYTNGETPNPCILCNRHIRWEFLLNQALALGANYMATGHYARVAHFPGEPVRLFRAKDKQKDQSYVLSVLNQDQLQHAMFPLGDYTKPEVRELAAKYNLPSAKTKDSQDLCFLAGTDYASFLKRNAPEVNQPGPIQRKSGELLGQHEGLAFYTIGQRKGLGVSYSEPLYVIAKNSQDNTLVVGTANELGSQGLTAANVNWVKGESPMDAFDAEIKIRYTAQLKPGKVTPLPDDRFQVHFEDPQRDITPGQGAVIYVDEEAVGSGIIEGIPGETRRFEPIRLLQTA
jgi:tRNA-specific 2-thiouridylase